MVECLFCSKNFSRKDSLQRHIKGNCSMVNLQDPEKRMEIYEKATTSSVVKVNNNSNNNNINIQNLTVNIQTLPINNLDKSILKNIVMKHLIDNFGSINSNFLFSDYLGKLIANNESPQNNSIKYVKKHPPTFSTTIEENGEIKSMIKNLNDTCELCTAPVLETLKFKLNECKKEFKTDEDFMDNYKSIKRDIDRELNNENVKKALKTVLSNDIINNIQMKLRNS